MVAIDGVSLENVVAVDDGGVDIFVPLAGVERGIVIAADGNGVYICCRGSLAVSTAHKELGEGELGIQFEVEATASASASG